jgi:hypothetical protein
VTTASPRTLEAVDPGLATYSSDDVCRLVSCTYRQLDWWTRSGVIEPAVPAQGSGTYRRWTAEQVRVVAAITVLRSLGCGEQAGRNATPQAEATGEHSASPPALAALPDDAWSGYAVVDRDGAVHPLSEATEGWLIDLAACAAVLTDAALRNALAGVGPTGGERAVSAEHFERAGGTTDATT